MYYILYKNRTGKANKTSNINTMDQALLTQREFRAMGKTTKIYSVITKQPIEQPVNNSKR